MVDGGNQRDARSMSSSASSDSSNIESSDSSSISTSSDTESNESCHESIAINSKSEDGQLTAINEEHSSDDLFIDATLKWTTSGPVGLGLCPWAVKSHNQGRLRIVKCDFDGPSDVASIIENEISSLTCDDKNAPPLSTTLLVCPHVKEWNEFSTFEQFVKHGIKQQIPHDELDSVTLVAFHPGFLKWHALPPGVSIGSTVYSHWGMVGQKSPHAAKATIVELYNRAFGLRRVKIRFTEDFEGRLEQYVPIDWIYTSKDEMIRGQCSTGAPLPDNFMYRSPYPTIHIINNEDLAKLCIRDVSRVKRLNARKMAKLGWDGLEICLAKNQT